MTTHTEIKTQDFITGFQYSKHYCSIGLGATMWLYIGIFAIEYFFYAVNGKLFRFIYNFTSSIITASWITFGVLVVHYISKSLQYLPGNKIFRRDKFDTITLALQFTADEIENE